MNIAIHSYICTYKYLGTLCAKGMCDGIILISMYSYIYTIAIHAYIHEILM